LLNGLTLRACIFQTPPATSLSTGQRRPAASSATSPDHRSSGPCQQPLCIFRWFGCTTSSRSEYLLDHRVKLKLIGIDHCLEVGLVLIILGVEIEDDFGELRHLLAHLVMQFVVHRLRYVIIENRRSYARRVQLRCLLDLTVLLVAASRSKKAWLNMVYARGKLCGLAHYLFLYETLLGALDLVVEPMALPFGKRHYVGKYLPTTQRGNVARIVW